MLQQLKETVNKIFGTFLELDTELFVKRCIKIFENQFIFSCFDESKKFKVHALFKFNRCGRLARAIVQNSIDSFDFVDDSVGNFT